TASATRRTSGPAPGITVTAAAAAATAATSSAVAAGTTASACGSGNVSITGDDYTVRGPAHSQPEKCRLGSLHVGSVPTAQGQRVAGVAGHDRLLDARPVDRVVGDVRDGPDADAERRDDAGRARDREAPDRRARHAR